MYNRYADDVADAIESARSLLDTMHENDMIEAVYGSDIESVLYDLDSASSDLDELDTLAEQGDREDYEDEATSLKDLVDDTASELDDVTDELRRIIRNLENA